jgi:hypothetical protein
VTQYQIAAGDSNVVLAPTLSLSTVVAASALIKITTNFFGIPPPGRGKKGESGNLSDEFKSKHRESFQLLLESWSQKGILTNLSLHVMNCMKLILSLELVYTHESITIQRSQGFISSRGKSVDFFSWLLK